MDEEQVRVLRRLLEETTLSTDSSDEEEISGENDIEDEESLDDDDDDEMGGGDETCQIHFYNNPDDNPYQVMDINTNDHVYQVIGNEIILIARGEGLCCLCGSSTSVLYSDNSYGNNIPCQLCNGCIQNIFLDPNA